MPWLQLSFEAPREQAERLAAVLEGAGALSVTLGDAGDDPQLEPGPGETPLWETTTVSALFGADPTGRALVDRLASSLAGPRVCAPRIERIEDRAWERVWLDDFRPTRFGRRLWVCPHGHPAGAPDAVVVALDPGLAFGTGHHPTTALCLEWLDGADLAGRTLLDYGCGSGILAIAALKLGAERAVAVDHDPQALEATRANALANGVADRIAIHTPDALPDEPANLVVANILAGPLTELAPVLIGHLQPGGDLALSGILTGQVADLIAVYSGRIELAPARTREDWALIFGRRRFDPCP